MKLLVDPYELEEFAKKGNDYQGIAGAFVFPTSQCEDCGRTYREGGHYCMSPQEPGNKSSPWIGWVNR